MSKIYTFVVDGQEDRGSVSPEAPRQPEDKPITRKIGEYFGVSAYVNPNYTNEPCFFNYWYVRLEVEGGGLIRDYTDSSPTINLMIEEEAIYKFEAHFITQSEIVTSDKGMTLRLKNNEQDTYYDFGEIQAVEVNYSARVTQKAIMTFDFQNALCYDMGVIKSYNLEFIRVNPRNPVSPSEEPNNTRNWSNADWIRGIRQLVNKWQGQHNGFKMFLVPDNDNLPHFPMSVENVFVGSSLTERKDPNVSSQAMSGTLALNVGSLYGMAGQGSEETTLTLYSNFPDGWQEPANDKTNIVSLNSTFTLPRDAEWTEVARKHNSTLASYNRDKSGQGQSYAVNDPIPIIEKDMKLYAIWSNFASCDTITEAGQRIGRISTDVDEIHVWVIGGGGAGGNGVAKASFSRVDRALGGGGGGGGQIREIIYPDITPADEWVLVADEIGNGGVYGKNNGDGGQTKYHIQTQEEPVYIIAVGGKGGTSGNTDSESVGIGGQGGGIYLHGREDEPISNNGGNGGRMSSDMSSISAIGGEADVNGGGRPGLNQVSGSYTYTGGGGGGGSVREAIDSAISASQPLDIKAGDGGAYEGNKGATVGQWGCGGGGGYAGWKTASIDTDIGGSGANGGKGCIIVIQYKVGNRKSKGGKE